MSWTNAQGNPLSQAVGDLNYNGVVDANETGELNDTSVGFEITDLDVGIALMVSTDLANAASTSPASSMCTASGWSEYQASPATGTFDVELNVGIGLTGFNPSLAVVDFDASFNELQALFDVIDTNNNNTLDTAELNAALKKAIAAPT